MDGKQYINGILLGNTSENSEAELVAVLGAPDANGNRVVGFIEKDSISGGEVQSVNGQTGEVVLDADDVLGFTPENVANKNANNGYAPLDSGGKIPLANLPSTLLKYQGVWNANTNTPSLTNPDLTKIGSVYNVAVSGTQFGINFNLGDWLIYNVDGIPEKSDNSDDVVSVNGQTGIVVLDANDIAETSVKKWTSPTEKNTWNDKIGGSGTVNYVPIFTDAKNITNSRILQVGTDEVRVVKPTESSLGISFFPNGTFKHLRLYRNQARIDFEINNPNTSSENIISSQNFYGTSFKSAGFLRFLVGSVASESAEGILEAMRILGTGLVQISGTSTKGLLGTSLFNKLNDPNAYPQLGDIAVSNSTATPLSLSDLNTAYPTLPTGFKVICPTINLIYIKSSLSTWQSIISTTVT